MDSIGHTAAFSATTPPGMADRHLLGNIGGAEVGVAALGVARSGSKGNVSRVLIAGRLKTESRCMQQMKDSSAILYGLHRSAPNPRERCWGHKPSPYPAP